MELDDAKNKFIQAWGTLGSNWGINKAMAQIHALLLLATQPLSAEDIMEQLQMSRGNVNMNLRALMAWGIIKKDLIIGERKEYFSAGKDVWELAKQVSKERRRREIEPIINVLQSIQSVSGDNKKALAEFRKTTSDLLNFSLKVDALIDKFSKSDQNWFYKVLMKL
jgi:DNA-binding transcriptional regulator GbsR (MarR family)